MREEPAPLLLSPGTEALIAVYLYGHGSYLSLTRRRNRDLDRGDFVWRGLGGHRQGEGQGFLSMSWECRHRAGHILPPNTSDRLIGLCQGLRTTTTWLKSELQVGS